MVLLPLFHRGLGEVFALPVRDGQEQRHYQSSEQLQVVGRQAQAQDKDHDDVVDDSADNGGKISFKESCLYGIIGIRITPFLDSGF